MSSNLDAKFPQITIAFEGTADSGQTVGLLTDRWQALAPDVPVSWLSSSGSWQVIAAKPGSNGIDRIPVVRVRGVHAETSPTGIAVLDLAVEAPFAVPRIEKRVDYESIARSFNTATDTTLALHAIGVAPTAESEHGPDVAPAGAPAPATTGAITPIVLVGDPSFQAFCVCDWVPWCLVGGGGPHQPVVE